MKNVIDFMLQEIERCKHRAKISSDEEHHRIADWYMRRVDDFIEAISILEKAENLDQS